MVPKCFCTSLDDAGGGDQMTPLQDQPQSHPDQEHGLYRVFIRDLVLPGLIGIHPHEKTAQQRIRLNIDLSVREPSGRFNERYETVVDYETVTNEIKALLGRGHVDLVETLAENIAEVCFRDRRVQKARIRVEKIDIIPEAGSVGVEIEHRRLA